MHDLTTKTPREVIAGTLEATDMGLKIDPRLYVQQEDDADAEMLSGADAILSALTSAGYTVEQGWQPIETAPTDGTPIFLLFNKSDGRPNGPTHWRPRPAPPATKETTK